MGMRISGFGQPTTVGGKKLDLVKRNYDFGKPASGGSGGTPSSGASDADVLSGFIEDMYGRFAPEQIEYDARSEEEIRSAIAAWLRPGYDQAITNRKEQTLTNKANLDADAIARGMGASTYVTDVKNRQQNVESRDIAAMESDYGSTLAKYVTEGVETETGRQLETEKFNAQLRQDAYELAYSAAVQLFTQYKKRSGGGSGGKSKKTGTTSRDNCEAFLGMLSGSERREVYEAATPAGEQYRSELLASVGTAGYIQLMGMYPSTP